MRIHLHFCCEHFFQSFFCLVDLNVTDAGRRVGLQAFQLPSNPSQPNPKILQKSSEAVTFHQRHNKMKSLERRDIFSYCHDKVFLLLSVFAL